MAITFQKATKKKHRLRLALEGPSGGGKTMSALAIAAGLGKRVAVIDTERGSASLYSGKFAFDVCELPTFTPASYREAIKAAEDAGYDVIVIDSLTHAWAGIGGALEMVDNAKSRAGGGDGNAFTSGWRNVTPEWNRLVETILTSTAHIIVTMRTHMEYVLETQVGKDGKEKKVPKKVGMAPVIRKGMEYEFDVLAAMDSEHNMVVSKTRLDVIDGQVIHKPGAELAKTLLDWLNSGEDVPVVIAAPVAAPAPPAVKHEPSPSVNVAAARQNETPPAVKASDAADYMSRIKACTTLDESKALMHALSAEFPTGHAQRGTAMRAWSEHNQSLSRG